MTTFLIKLKIYIGIQKPGVLYIKILTLLYLFSYCIFFPWLLCIFWNAIISETKIPNKLYWRETIIKCQKVGIQEAIPGGRQSWCESQEVLAGWHWSGPVVNHGSFLSHIECLLSNSFLYFWCLLCNYFNGTLQILTGKRAKLC
jgi:hypothetical protein